MCSSRCLALHNFVMCGMSELEQCLQDVGATDATMSEPADGAAAQKLVVDSVTKKSREEAPPQAARDAAAKHGGKGEVTGDKSEKEAEKARDKEKKKKFKMDEELLQAFRYFDRNCECPWPFLVQAVMLMARSCCTEPRALLRRHCRSALCLAQPCCCHTFSLTLWLAHRHWIPESG